MTEVTKPAKRGRPKSRANATGTIFKMPGGRFRWQFRNAQSAVLATGIAKTKREAETALSSVRADAHRGVLASPDRMTLNAYSAKWLHDRRDIRPNTRRMYQTEVGYALVHIGKMQLREVRPTHIKSALSKLSEQVMKGGSRLGKTMSQRTLGMVRSRLKTIFAEAVRDQIIYVNPVDATRRIRLEDDAPEEGIALDFDQAARLHELGEALHEAGESRLWPAIFAAVSIGLRRGEVMGLRWSDVDLENTVLHVRNNLTQTEGAPILGKPKTRNSVRDIPMTSSLKAMLERHKVAQASERAFAGRAWISSDAVFATELGAFTHPALLDRALKGIIGWSDREAKPEVRKGREPKRVVNETRTSLERRMRAINVEHRARLEAVIFSGKPLPRISPHDLRHTAGTLMLRRGMPVEVVSKILGHARVSITLDVYRHVLDSEKRAVMVDLFPEPVPNRAVRAASVN